MYSLIRNALLVPLLLGPLGCGGGSGGGNGVDDLIRSVKDLPDPIDSDKETPLPPTFPPGGGVCEWKKREYTFGANTFQALSPHADVIYPGADLQGKTLVDGIPAPITAPRGGGAIAIDAMNGSLVSKVELDEITLGKVTDAINEIIRAQPDSFAADLSLQLSRVRTREEMQIAMNVSASYFGMFEANASFSLRTDERYSHFLLALQQNSFTVAFERPSRPSEFYARGVSATDLASQVGPGNPATYVSEVTYGGVFYLLIEAREREEDVEATLDANILGLIDGDGKFHYLTEFSGLDLKAYAYGGDQEALLSAILNGLDSWKDLKRQLLLSRDLRTAKPVSYTVRSVATDEVVKQDVSASYEYSVCQFPDDCVPVLLSPTLGTAMDNGCGVDPDPVRWSFVWTACDFADRYQIQVTQRDLGVLANEEVKDPGYTYKGTLPFEERSGWQWHVRAQVAGEWYPWSRARSFTLEPFNQDCKTGIVLYTHPNFGGEASRLIMGDVSNLEDLSRSSVLLNWDDEIDSVRLFNVRGVRLFLDPNNRGDSFYFDHDCPDVFKHRSHGFPANRASSLVIDK